MSAPVVDQIAVIAAAKKHPALRQAIIDAAVKADLDLVGPLLQFRNYGIPLANNLTTIINGAAFGTDYYTRTAVARSNILVNKNNETKYVYQDLDAAVWTAQTSTSSPLPRPAAARQGLLVADDVQRAAFLRA